MKLDSRAWIALVVVGLFVFFVYKMFENQLNQKNSETNQGSTENTPAKSDEDPVAKKQDEKKPDSRSISSIPPESSSQQQTATAPSPLASTSTLSQPAVIQDLVRNLKEKTGLSSWQVDGTTETVVVSGEIFKFPMGAIADRLQWGRFLAEQMGVNPEQVVDIGSTQADSSFSKSYELNQSYHGYLVDGAFVRIHQRKDDGSVYFSSVKLIEIGHPELQIKVGQAEAQQSMKTRYPAGTTVSVLKQSKDPVIFPLSQGQSELAWRFEIKLVGALTDTRELIVSAKTGFVLRELSTRMF